MYTNTATLRSSFRKPFAILLALLGLSQAFAADPNFAYAVADSGDTLVKMNRLNGSNFQVIGGTGTLTIEAIEWNLDSTVLYAADAGQFGSLNLSNGNFTSIGSGIGTGSGAVGNVSFNDVDGLTIDARTGITYGSVRLGADDLLIQIDTGTGAHIPDAFGANIDYVVINVTSLGLGLVDIDDIAIDPTDGQMYGVANDNGGNDRLVRIDKTNGNVTDVGRIRLTGGTVINDMEGFSFYNDGTFYGTTGNNGNFVNRMWEVDTATGISTEIGQFGSGSDYEAIGALTGGANTVTGTAFFDSDGNASYAGADTPEQGVIVRFYVDEDSSGDVSPGDTLVQTTTTAADGTYSFQTAAAGDFLVEVDETTLPASATGLTTPEEYAVNFVGFGNTVTDKDFGYSEGGSIGDYVWYDLDGDGVQEAGEPGIPGVDVTLSLPGGGTLTTTTDANGFYIFESSETGTFTVTVDTADLPAGLTQTKDPDSSGAPNESDLTFAVVGESNLDQDFGYQPSGSLSGTLYEDVDQSGSGAGTEPSFAGITVALFQADGVTPVLASNGSPLTTVTDANGLYSFNNLVGGNYVVIVDGLGSYDNLEEPDDPSGGNDRKAAITLAAGGTVTGQDFGFYLNAGNLTFPKTVSSSTANGGDTLTYEFTPSWAGNDILTDIVVTDSVPTGSVYAGGDVPSATSEPSIGGTGTVSWNLGSNIAGVPSNKPGTQGAWGSLENITNEFGGQDSQGPEAVAFDSTGVAHVVFQGKDADGGDGKKNFYYTKNTGGTWSTPVRVSTDNNDVPIDPANGILPSIGIASDGTVYVSYPEKGSGDSKANIYVAKITTGGTVTRTKVTTDSDDSEYSSIAVDGSGNIHVVFSEKKSGDSKLNVYYRRSTNGGTSFSATELFTDDDENGLAPKISVSSSGYVGVTYLHKGDGDSKKNIYVVRGTTGAWQPPLALSDDTEGQDAQLVSDVFVTDSNVVHAVWSDRGTGSNVNVWYTNSDSWGGNLERISNDSDDALYPTVAVDNFGYAHVAYSQKVSKMDVFYTNNRTGTFAAVANLTNNLNGSDSISPVLDATSGAIHLVLAGEGPDAMDIFYRNAPISPTLDNSISVDQSLVNGGDTITVTQTLTSSGALTGVTPGALAATINGTNGVVATRVSGPTPATHDLTANVPATFTWTYSVANGTAAGSVSFSNTASGSSQTWNSASSNSTIVTAPLSFDVSIPAAPTVTPVTNRAFISDSSGTISSTPSNQVSTDVTLPGNISGFVQRDITDDGVADEPIENVTLTLVDSSGNPVDGDPNTSGVQPVTTTTNSSGAYSFNNLVPGTYGVEETQPSGYVSVSDTDGGDPDEIRPIVVTSGATNSGNNFLEVESVSISGNVFNDANGLEPTPVNTVDGTTYAGGTVYANLVNGGTVVQAVEVTSGAYDFTGVAGYKDYTVVLSTTQGTIGNAAPSASLPSGYVNTGENVGAGTGSDGTVDGNLAVSVTNTSVTNVNFGVEVLPTAAPVTASSQINPGGTTRVAVPTLSGTDPEDPSVTTFVIKTLPTDGTLYYNNIAVTADQSIPNFDSSLLTVDPIDGSPTVSFTYSVVDAAAQESSPATVSMPFTSVSLSGNVFDDANGLLGTPVNTVDGTAYAGPTLYANLISGGNVAQVATVTAGSYGFGTVAPNTSYTVVLSTTQGTVGAAAPSAALPAGYVNTGENLGAGTGSDGTVDGNLAVNVTTSSVTNANFGVEQPPTASDVSLASQLNPAGTAEVTAPILTGTDPEDATVTTFIINTLPSNGTLYYNGTAVTLGQTITSYDDTLLTLDPDDGAITASFTYSAVDTAGESSTPATVTMPFTNIGLSGNVFDDANGLLGTPVNTVDGTAYAGPTLYANLVDAGGNVAQVATVTAGAYDFDTVAPNTNYTVILSTTQGTVGAAAPSAALPSNYVNTGENLGAGTGSDGTVDGNLAVPVTTSSVDNANFGVRENGTVTGHLYIDTNGNGTQDSGEPDLANVDVIITDSLGAQQTVSTNSTGDWTASVPPGSTTADVDETDPQYPTGSTQKEGTDPTTVTAVAGTSTSAGNDGYFVPGSISGSVLAGMSPLEGVTLTLVDSSGDPVDGDTGTAGIQEITTTSAANGTYSFGDLAPGTYGVKETQPVGYDSVSDKDGGDLDEIRPIVVTAGATNTGNDFVEALGDCPANWAEWMVQNPGETADGNPEGDAYDNLTEFAFAMPVNSGAGDAWRIQPSEITPGKLDGVFTRPVGAPDNVVYTLQYASTIADPTVWVDIIITPAMYTVVNNGDCTETLTLTDLETLTGLTGGKGVVRIKADLDEENDDNVDHTSYTEAEGWKETDFGICCQTYATPYLRDTVFTGTVDAGGVSGQVISFSGSAGSDDIGSLLTSGVSYFLEVTSGAQEGQRFDIVSASGSDITVANDASLSSNAAPYNTLIGAPPANLAGSSVVVRRHWTVDEMFPPSGFVATGDQATADQLQLFFGGVWTILHLYDDGGTPRWVDNFNDQVSQGGTIIPPGHGMFFNNRNSAVSLLTYGEVRENDFIRPLVSGYNFVGGGYPLSQSATGTDSRTMSLTEGFFGSKDFKTADSFFLWKGDATPGLSTYDTYYLLHHVSLQRWVKVGDSSATPRDAEILLLENRAAFTRSASGLSTYGYPSPWSP
ncbi:MAG: SdrD B-like domain-containing protein [Luteolibacter sp.]